MAPTVSPGPGVRPRRRGRWRLLLVALLLVVPLLEVLVIIAVGRAIGGWPTFVLILAVSAFGAWLVRHEGARAWQSLQTAVSTGTTPSRELSDAAVILVGGLLLLVPGFLTDVVGLVLVLPFTRPAARRLLEAVIARRLVAGGYAPGGMPPPAFGPGPRGSGQGPDPSSRSAASDDIIEGEVL
jgi:UPF0716 protein FxsA